MRKGFPVVLDGNGRWGPKDAGGNLPPFNWVLVDNRSGHDVAVAIKATPSLTDDQDYLRKVKTGKCRVFNVAPSKDHMGDGDEMAHRLHIVGTAADILYVEIADYPIVDFTLTI